MSEVSSTRQAIEPYDLSEIPECELSFDELVFKGYNADDDHNKKVQMSLRHYPLSTYVAFKYIINHSDDYSMAWRLKYIGDAQVFSSKLGLAIIQNLDIYHEISQHYHEALDSQELYVQSALETAANFTFTNVIIRQRTFKTLFYIHEEVQNTSNMLGLYPSSLIMLASIAGLTKAKLPERTMEELTREYNKFLSHLRFVSKKYQSFNKY